MVVSESCLGACVRHGRPVGLHAHFVPLVVYVHAFRVQLSYAQPQEGSCLLSYLRLVTTQDTQDVGGYFRGSLSTPRVGTLLRNS